MGREKGWRWRAGLCHFTGVGIPKCKSLRRRFAPNVRSRKLPPVSVAIVFLLRRGRIAPLRRSTQILSLTRWTAEAVPDLADPDALFAPAQDGAKGLQLGVIEGQEAAPRPRRRLDDPLA
jgi:hypothetical protein